MKVYKLKYSKLAVEDVVRLARYVTAIYTHDSARKYVAQLRTEIESLSYLAGLLQESKYELPKLYHPQAKTLSVGKRKLTVIFHTEGEYVMIDKILPSCMITH